MLGTRRYIYFWLILFSLLAPTVSHTQSNEDALFALVNDLRARLGRQQLTRHESLRVAAAEQARWMAETGRIAHSHDGSTHRTRARAAGYAANWIGEIIYMSPNPSHIPAWQFWLNSQIHYDTMIIPSYEHMGVASHTVGQRKAYVIVFGNLSGTVRSAPANDAGAATGNDAAANRQPIGLEGQDEHGYILHRIQPGETLGELTIIYGYRGWEISATLEALNNINRYALAPGEVIRIPPFDGTWTPAPLDAPTLTPVLPAVSRADEPAPTVITPVSRATVTPPPSSTPLPTILAGEPRVLEIATSTPVAAGGATGSSDDRRRAIVIALILALGAQGALLLGIGALYFRQRGR